MWIIFSLIISVYRIIGLIIEADIIRMENVPKETILTYDISSMIIIDSKKINAIQTMVRVVRMEIQGPPEEDKGK
jgi:hypothetical protein